MKLGVLWEKKTKQVRSAVTVAEENCLDSWVIAEAVTGVLGHSPNKSQHNQQAPDSL